MNCQLCQKESEGYREGILPAEMRIQIETHLGVCKKCATGYKLQTLAERVIEKEKELLPNPFLLTRIMAKIEKTETERNSVIPAYMRVLRPAIMAASLAAAIFLGVIMGSIYRPAGRNTTIPVELALIDDAAIESVEILSNE
jgi:anti-sigma factor RsiW